MEAPLFFRLAELTPPLSLPDERRLADAGQLNNLRVGMVLEQRHRMVELLGIEFGRAALTEIRVGRARDRLALLCCRSIVWIRCIRRSQQICRSRRNTALIRIESIRLPQRKTADSPAYDWRTT